MSSLRTLLQHADPLRHEPPHLDAARDRLRRTVVAAAPAGSSGRSLGAGFTLASAFAVLALVMGAIGYQIWARGTTPVLAAVRFEVRLAEDRPVPGLVVAEVAGSDRLIYLHPEIVVNNDDIAQSWVTDDGRGRFGIAVAFLPSGAERMRRATETHLSRPLAILIDGIVVATPVIRSAIGESAMISGDFTQAEAERIANGIARR